jgi:hypothetical protein
VWLGTAYGSIQSWGDTQVVARVAAGSSSGEARILQNGVWSNAVAFDVNRPHIYYVDPESAAPGAPVTIYGAGFGAARGNGVVWLGSTAGQAVSWSDTEIVAQAASGSLTGIARVQQNGMWSNAVKFAAPDGGGQGVTLVPNLMNLAVGETRTLQALNAAGEPVTGLTWASSDPNVASVSGGDSPVLSAISVGHATVTAGSASTDVTVMAGDLAEDTVLWSNPGGGVSVASLAAAVPSPSGVADVFAVEDGGTVEAITSEGMTAWRASLPSPWAAIVPDFQGGLIANDGLNIVRLDGTTGASRTL